MSTSLTIDDWQGYRLVWIVDGGLGGGLGEYIAKGDVPPEEKEERETWLAYRAAEPFACGRRASEAFGFESSLHSTCMPVVQLSLYFGYSKRKYCIGSTTNQRSGNLRSPSST